MVSQTPLQADLTVMNCRARGRSAPDERRGAPIGRHHDFVGNTLVSATEAD